MRITTPCSRTNWSMICCPVIPCSASPTTCWCIAGLTVQVKSVVRQVYTSRLQPQVQWSCLSIARMTASLSAAVTGSRGLPARAGSQRRREGPVPGRESCPDCRTGGRADRNTIPAMTLRNARLSQSACPPVRLSAVMAPPPAVPHTQLATVWRPASLPATSRSTPRRGDHPPGPPPPPERGGGEPEDGLPGALPDRAEGDVEILAQILPDADPG